MTERITDDELDVMMNTFFGGYRTREAIAIKQLRARVQELEGELKDSERRAFEDRHGLQRGEADKLYDKHNALRKAGHLFCNQARDMNIDTWLSTQAPYRKLKKLSEGGDDETDV
jgi:hypothetical protein